VLSGVKEKVIKEVFKRDKAWLTNGKFGLIQFHNFE
jgi:hypothetical protein